MSEKEKLLRRVAELCSRNAEQYVKDGELLVKKGSYGHAFALAVFAEEELAKAITYHLCAEGIYGIRGKWREDSLRHQRKHEFAFQVAWLYEMRLILEEAAEYARNKAKNNPVEFKKIFERKTDEILHEEQELFASKQGEVYEHLKPFEGLQKKREKAMYVEVNLQENRTTSPMDFRKSEAKQFISHVKERVKALKDEISQKMELRYKRWAMGLMKKRLSQFNDKEKKRLLEWYGLSVEDLDRFCV